MISYLQTLNVPSRILLIIIAITCFSECLKVITNIWGFFAPKVLRIQTNMSRRADMERMLLENQKSLMSEQSDILALNKKYDIVVSDLLDVKTLISCLGDDITDMRIKDMRKTILDFASDVGENKRLHTEEHYNDIFLTYEEYEQLLSKKGLTNGQAELSMEIIRERYKDNKMNNRFLNTNRGKCLED